MSLLRRSNASYASAPVRLPRARTEELVVEELDDEVLVYDRTNKRAHCLTPDAARVWRACDGSTDVEHLADALDLAVDTVVEAIAELERAELLESHELEILDGNGNGDGGMTRRELTRRTAQVGTAVAAAPLILSITAPTAMAAVSPPPFVCQLYTTQDCGTGAGCAAIKGCCCCCQGQGSCKICSSVDFCNSGQQSCLRDTAKSQCSSVGSNSASTRGCCGVDGAKQCGCAWGSGGGCCDQHTGQPCTPSSTNSNCVPCCCTGTGANQQCQILQQGSTISCCDNNQNNCVTTPPA